jgi:AAA15 family ATPase/GTPase
MISTLTIKNFKSILDLSISCKKLNIFIGEPNTGKSNILEALALLSQNIIKEKLNQEIFRYKSIGDLFYDFNINNPIEIITDNKKSVLEYSVRDDGTPENRFIYLQDSKESSNPTVIEHDGKVSTPGVNNNDTIVRYYEFKRLSRFMQGYQPHLTVPYGDNLPTLLLSSGDYKKWVSDFLKSKGLKLTFKPAEFDILVSKLVDDEIYSYPYFSLSETLQRIIFYTIAIKSNKEKVLLFDEPESNTFPFYTKFLAERIALDNSNQFFITTHNPYMLLNLIEKSNKDDINVSIVCMKDFKTCLSELYESQIAEVLEYNSDAFFNLNKILGI